jgi:hypothetical protein
MSEGQSRALPLVALLAALAAGLPAQALVWTFTEQQTATCGRTPHPRWDPAQYVQVPTMSALGGGFGLTWVDFTPGQLAVVLFDYSRLTLPWAPMSFVLPTYWNLSTTTAAGQVTFSWQLPAVLPLSVAPAGVHYAGAGQVVALCVGTLAPCESSYTFDVWCRR